MDYTVRKTAQLILIFIITVLLFSCNNNSFDEIEIGMTYEEVESQLGKPIAIERGANQLEAVYPSEFSDRLNFDTTLGMSSSRWFAPHSINKIGQLIYVNWVYNDVKSDTFFMVLDKYVEKIDTLTKKVPAYYLGSRRVSSEEYEKFKGIEYKLKSGRIVTQGYYESYKRLHPKDVLEPVRIEKKIIYETKANTLSSQTKSGIEKRYYVINYKNCILFDASSGRVVEKGYFPYSINLINQ